MLDESTLFTLYKLSNKGYFDLLYGFIKQGKESNILLGETKDGQKLAIKIHAISASNFKRIHPYILGDERFRRIKMDKRNVIFAWCKKEFKNMLIAEKAGIALPKPIAQMNNVLLMEFLGKDFEPAPRLCDIVLEKPEKIFKLVIQYIDLLYKNGLIHGDLSAYNILFFDEKPYFIDFSQGVLSSHPNALILLERDIKNVCKDFAKYGIECDAKEIYDKIVGGPQ
jgi:RIO kinase 1